MTVLTIGTFDLFHIGHLNLLDACKLLGDSVVVGVNSDQFVSDYKGSAPIVRENDRAELITRLGFKTEINDSAGRELIERVHPRYLVIGSDWARKDYLAQIGMTQDELDKLDIILCYVPYTPNISTTELKRRINEN